MRSAGNQEEPGAEARRGAKPASGGERQSPPAGSTPPTQTASDTGTERTDQPISVKDAEGATQSTRPPAGVIVGTTEVAKKGQVLGRLDRRRIGRKCVSWAALVILASLPILLRIFSAWRAGEEMTKVSLFSDGELLIVAAAISATGLVDLFDRKHKEGEMSVGQRAAMVFALLVAIFAASGYQGVKSDEDAQQVVSSKEAPTHRQEVTAKRNADAALMFYVAALFAGFSCAILAATPGSSEV